MTESWPWRKFERWEFSCKCGCGFDTVDAELVVVLLDVKKHFNGATVHINSGCRCVKHNRNIGGRYSSYHLLGRAADITVEGHPPLDVYAYLCGKHPHKFGIGLYDDFVHIDTRSVGMWRQD